MACCGCNSLQGLGHALQLAAIPVHRFLPREFFCTDNQIIIRPSPAIFPGQVQETLLAAAMGTLKCAVLVLLQAFSRCGWALMMRGPLGTPSCIASLLTCSGTGCHNVLPSTLVKSSWLLCACLCC